MVLLVASETDIAGKNISEECEKIGLKVHYIKEELLYVQNLPDADYYIFLSKHKSKSKKPCLTAHFPGNFSENKFGGNKNELGFAFPSLQKKFMKNLYSINNLEKYQIVIEATHHGPTCFKKPIMFVEIGSSEKEWKDKKAAKIIARSIKKTIYEKQKKFKPSIAFGGTHYPKKFMKVLLKTDYSIGHIIPKYNLENLDEKIFEQMIEKSSEKI